MVSTNLNHLSTRATLWRRCIFLYVYYSQCVSQNQTNFDRCLIGEWPFKLAFKSSWYLHCMKSISRPYLIFLYFRIQWNLKNEFKLHLLINKVNLHFILIPYVSVQVKSRWTRKFHDINKWNLILTKSRMTDVTHTKTTAKEQDIRY